VNSDFRVGPWTARPSINTLSQNGTSARLEPKVMEVLVRLACEPGDVVSKENILKTVWPDTFVSDDVLIRSVSELRRVFGDDAREPHFIETIPKRGYRLVAPVERLNSAVRPVPVEVTEDFGQQTSHNRRFVSGMIFLGAILSAGALLVFNVGGLRDRLSARGTPAIHSIAILPLEDLSGDPPQDYFALGMTDALITEISRARELKVISRKSVMAYQGTHKGSTEIARELKVDALLEGTVQRSNDRVRISLQLIYGPEDRHLWANSYDRDINDVFALEQDVAKAVTKEIQIQLAPKEHRARESKNPTNLKALEAYLKGQYHRTGLPLGHYGRESEYDRGVQEAIGAFEDAIREDPGYAPAYVALAEVWAWERPGIAAPLLRGSDGAETARRRLKQALSLDPDLAEVHLNLGRIAFFIDWNWVQAEQEFRLAIDLNPNLAVGHECYAEYLDAMGRLDEAVNEFNVLQQLDPNNQQLPDEFYHRRRFDKVIELRRVHVETHVYGEGAHLDLAAPLIHIGRYREAVDEWIELMTELEYPDAPNELRRGYRQGGFEGAVKAYVQVAERYKDSSAVPTWFAAYLYTLLADKDKAIAGLERAFAARDGSMPFLTVDPDWDNLRSDPRFKDLVRRVGLPQ